MTLSTRPPSGSAGRSLLLILLLAGVTLRAAPSSTARADELRARIRSHFFVPTPLPDPAAITHRRFSPAPGVTAEAVTYATQLGMRVPAILYLPASPPAGGKIPALVVINGHGGDKYSWYAYYTGVSFARAGMAVLTYDQAGEGERSSSRRSGTREHDKLQGDEILARRLAGLMITDAMQAVAYLASRPEIDASRLGAVSYSLGTMVLALTGAMETRLRACVLAGGGNLDGPDGYWDRSKPMCQGLPYRSLSFLGDRAAEIYSLHADRGPLLIWNGRADTVVNMPQTQESFFEDLRARVVARRGESHGVFEYGFTAGTSHRPYWLTRPTLLWLERHLDFPLWTEASLRQAPETHIGTWARREGVPLDPLYATEEREGGTPAIGGNAPGVTRESLSVFPSDEWEQTKDSLILHQWMVRAQKVRDLPPEKF